jgi:hypothetical protein
MDRHGPQWTADDLPAQAGGAVQNLLLGTIRHGTAPERTHQLVEEHLAVGERLAEQFPDQPWQARSVPVDDVEYAMWFATLPAGFAAALDYGPVVLTAWGRDPDRWDWHLTAAPPDAVWPLIEAAFPHEGSQETGA